MELPPRGDEKWTGRNAQEFLAGKYAGDEGSLIRQAQQIVCELGRSLIAAAKLVRAHDPVYLGERVGALEREVEDLSGQLRDLRSQLRSV